MPKGLLNIDQGKSLQSRNLSLGLDAFDYANGLPDGSLARYEEVLRNVFAQGALVEQVWR